MENVQAMNTQPAATEQPAEAALPATEAAEEAPRRLSQRHLEYQ